MSNDYCLLFFDRMNSDDYFLGGAKVKMSQNSPFLHNMISNERVESNYRFAITACSHKKNVTSPEFNKFFKKKALLNDDELFI